MTGLIPGVAQAQRVYTLATVRDFPGQAIYAGYNAQTDLSFGGFNAGDFGRTFGDGCNGVTGCSGGAGTTPATASPTEYAARSTATLSDSFMTGSAAARASLYTGEIGADAEGAFRACPGYTCWIRSTAVAQIGEGLHFAIGGADATTHTSIGVSFDVDGAMGVPVDGDNPFAQGLLNIFENGNVSASFLTQINPFGASSSAGGSWLSYSIGPNEIGHVSFSGVYDLVGATHDLGIGYSLFASSGTAYSDYLSTGKLRFDLPANVKFTSDSGVFLTGAGAGAAPEPGLWALLELGVGLVGTLLRKTRSTVRAAA